ncbi:MAG TPA: DUF3179 domain-containing (seleno)protein [Nitrososphaeraceae archaeon]|jgi:hypothetical protein|nr:DUF3179 domain-containing (seleno)protein [Nitrososphaeraceae archaeon]
MTNNQTTISISKNYYDKHNCIFAFCESCYWFATILVEEFGTSGKLYNSNLVMYDRTSNSLWSQALGEGIVGEYAGKN